MAWLSTGIAFELSWPETAQSGTGGGKAEEVFFGIFREYSLFQVFTCKDWSNNRRCSGFMSIIVVQLVGVRGRFGNYTKWCNWGVG